MMRIIVAKIYNVVRINLEKCLQAYLRNKFFLSNKVFFNSPLQTTLTGNIMIGDGTYVNSGRLITGKNSKIAIGKNCAIGHNVTISAITHDLSCPTGPNIRHKEADVLIGDNVWIGSNVFIKEGITIGNNVVIGANSVVTKSFGDNTIIAGMPARIIKTTNKENDHGFPTGASQ